MIGNVLKCSCSGTLRVWIKKTISIPINFINYFQPLIFKPSIVLFKEMPTYNLTPDCESQDFTLIMRTSLFINPLSSDSANTIPDNMLSIIIDKQFGIYHSDFLTKWNFICIESDLNELPMIESDGVAIGLVDKVMGSTQKTIATMKKNSIRKKSMTFGDKKPKFLRQVF